MPAAISTLGLPAEDSYFMQHYIRKHPRVSLRSWVVVMLYGAYSVLETTSRAWDFANIWFASSSLQKISQGLPWL